MRRAKGLFSLVEEGIARKGCLKAGTYKCAWDVKYIFNRVTIHWNKLSLKVLGFSFCFQIKTGCLADSWFSPTKLCIIETQITRICVGVAGRCVLTCKIQINLYDLMEFSELKYWEFSSKWLSILFPKLSSMFLPLISSLLVHAHWCREPLTFGFGGF